MPKKPKAKAKAKGKRKAPSAKQLANQRRFAAMARARAKSRKGRGKKKKSGGRVSIDMGMRDYLRRQRRYRRSGKPSRGPGAGGPPRAWSYVPPDDLRSLGA